MGFGTLFIGYFLLINITYFSYTDAIAAMIMLTGLYQLSAVNRGFRRAATASAVFAVIAVAELVLTFIGFFVYTNTLNTALSYLGVLRYAAIFTVSLFMNQGIHEVASEVDAPELASTAKRSMPLCSAFAIASVLELPFLSALIGKAIAYVYFITATAVVFLVISNLVTIYKAYSQICMPDQIDKSKKQKKNSILNKFYESMENSGKEYAEYRQKRKKDKLNKRNK